jgi:MFS transporter, DHA1 family, multidrug resistance protein
LKADGTGVPTGRSWIWNVAVLWLAVLIAIMGMSLVIPFLPLYLKQLHVPDSESKLWAGWVGGANFLCAALFAPIWGSVADRYGRKPMALRALVGLAISVGLMGYAQDVYQLFGLRLLQGAFGGFVAAAIALVGISVPREHLGSALGFLQSAVVGGNLVGPLFGGELSHHFGYRDTFRITGGALILAALLVLFLVRERHEPPPETKGALGSGVRELLRVPQLRWMLLVVLFSQCGLMLINPQISLFVKDLVGDSGQLERLVGAVIAAPALTSFLAAPGWGRLGDRRGHARVLGLALLGAGLIIPWAAAAAAVWQLFAVRMLMGAFTSALNPSTHSAVAHSVPEYRTAAAFSLLSSSQMLGSCIGPFASGPIAVALGVRVLFPITGALLIAAGVASLRTAALTPVSARTEAT